MLVRDCCRRAVLAQLRRGDAAFRDAPPDAGGCVRRASPHARPGFDDSGGAVFGSRELAAEIAGRDTGEFAKCHREGTGFAKTDLDADLRHR